MSATAIYSLTGRTLRMFMCVVLVALSLMSGGKAQVLETGVSQHSWFQDGVSNHLQHDAHGHHHGDADDLDQQLADHHRHLEPIHDVMAALFVPGAADDRYRQAWLVMPDDRAHGRPVGCPLHPPSV